MTNEATYWNYEPTSSEDSWRLHLHGASEEDLIPSLDSPRFESDALRRLRAANFKRGPEWRI